MLNRTRPYFFPSRLALPAPLLSEIGRRRTDAFGSAWCRGLSTATFSKLGHSGQFGNQLFQIAAVIGYCRTWGVRPALPKWICEAGDRAYEDVFPAIGRYQGTTGVSYLYHEPAFAYGDLPFAFDIDLRGYFQSERYFSHCAAEVRMLFSEPTDIARELNAYCAAHGLAAGYDALHVRFYAHPERDVGPLTRLPEKYYSAVESEMGSSSALVIATDDKAALAEMLARWSPKKPVHVLTFDDALYDFYMLSRARRLAISNSSFSWWAAYLGSPKIVLAPHRYFWFSDPRRRDTSDLYPTSFRELLW